MSIALAEALKQEWTDQYVVVAEEAAELRRFAGLTGQVKTVNMNCRALVQFDGPADIAWYDIDPSYLTKVDAPLPKKKEGHKAPPAVKAEAPQTAAAKPAAVKPAAGMSPLELARQQGAQKSAAVGGEKQLSPLELARQQGAAKAGGESAPVAAGGEKKLSPLEMARMQGAAKSGGTQTLPAAEAPVPNPAPATTPPAAPVPTVVAQVPAAPVAKAAAAVGEKPGSTAEIIALARQQGAFKG